MVAAFVNSSNSLLHTPAPLLVVLVGPTASGKTALSLKIAEALGGEVVSCDSVAVYQELEIGTAKPSHEARACVPHHLIDVVPPIVEYTAGDYGRAARAAVHRIADRGRVCIVTGGSGLYLRALLDGLSPVPGRDEDMRERLRQAAERRGPKFLHYVLRRLDAAAAKRIHANDVPKLIRAIEISVLGKTAMSAAWEAQQPQPLTGFRIVQIGLEPDRSELYRRINARCAQMFADGLVEETEELVRRYGPDCRALHALGYAESQAVLRGKLTEAEAIVRAQTGHRHYSKRQRTWFRRDTRVTWIKAFGEDAPDAAMQLIFQKNN